MLRDAASPLVSRFEGHGSLPHKLHVLEGSEQLRREGRSRAALSTFLDGFVFFMYFPNDQVRLVATPYFPGYPKFAYDLGAAGYERDELRISRFLAETALDEVAK